MADLRGIEADFATWRPVQGRKVLQLVFEVPIEQTQHVLDMLGIPQPGASKWCAIALMAPKAEGQAEGGSPKKAWTEYKPSQQAAILCSDSDFQRYFNAVDEKQAAARVRVHFKVESRSELDTPEMKPLWDEFVALYRLHCERLK
jgi:hypothetical protein